MEKCQTGLSLLAIAEWGSLARYEYHNPQTRSGNGSTAWEDLG